LAGAFEYCGEGGIDFVDPKGGVLQYSKAMLLSSHVFFIFAHAYEQARRLFKMKKPRLIGGAFDYCGEGGIDAHPTGDTSIPKRGVLQ
jgi:hypothetical protein